MPAPQFDAVDATDPQASIGFLDTASALAAVKRYKQRSAMLLQIGAGDRVLDAGCGTGLDAMAMAELVGTGKVVGIDLSHSMVAEATARASGSGLPVSFRQADIRALPFADGDFDCVHADRVLHFLDDPRPAVAELARVAVGGARVVISEPDWGSLTVESGSASVDAVSRRLAGLLAGRQTGSDLGTLMAGAGLSPAECRRTTLELGDFTLASYLFSLDSLAEGGVEHGLISREEGRAWRGALRAAAERGTFRATLSGVTSLARKA